MVKKRIVIFSLVLLCSSVAMVDASNRDSSTLSDDLTDNPSLPLNPNKVLQELTGNRAIESPNSTFTTDSAPEGPSIPDKEKELRDASGRSIAAIQKEALSRIAVLENALNHLDSSLASDFLSTDAREKINKEIETHKNLIHLEINALAAQVSDSLKSKDFSDQVVLNVIAACRDLKNREAVVTGALANIAAEIARINADAAMILSPSDRAPLNAQRAELEKIEAALGDAKARIVKAVPYAAQASDVTLFGLNPNTHGNVLRVALVTGGFATAVLLGLIAKLLQPE